MHASHTAECTHKAKGGKRELFFFLSFFRLPPPPPRRISVGRFPKVHERVRLNPDAFGVARVPALIRGRRRRPALFPTPARRRRGRAALSLKAQRIHQV